MLKEFILLYMLYSLIHRDTVQVGCTAFAVPSPRSDHVVPESRAAEPIHWTKTAGRLV